MPGAPVSCKVLIVTTLPSPGNFARDYFPLKNESQTLSPRVATFVDLNALTPLEAALSPTMSIFFFWCELSKDVGAWLLNFLRNRIPTSPHAVLNFNLDDDEPLIWVIIQTLCFIWDKRINSKEAKVAEFLGKLADRANILRETWFSYIPNNVMDHILIFNNF